MSSHVFAIQPPAEKASATRRSYQACIPCRARKVRCDLGNSDGQPCARCRRERKECVFGAPRGSKANEGFRPVIQPTAAATEAVVRSPEGHEAEDGSTVAKGSKRQSQDELTTQASKRRRDKHSSEKGRQGDRATSSVPPTSESNGDGVVQVVPGETTGWPNDTQTGYSYIGSGQRFQFPEHESPASSRAERLLQKPVSNPNDVLNLLYEAAELDAQENDAYESTDTLAFPTGIDPELSGETTIEDITNPGRGSKRNINKEGGFEQHHHHLTGPSPSTTLYSALTPAAVDAIEVWNNFRFVKQKWITAREALLLVDLFFRNLAPLTPIVGGFYSRHANHWTLVSQEAILCSTIMTISSRYHALPGPCGLSRGYMIHDRFWRFTQTLLQRVIFGQEKISTAKTRRLGTVESLLLLTEWYPRAIHFPPESDGWDSALIHATDSTTDETVLEGGSIYDEKQEAEKSASSNARWLEDVVEPLHRSERMSWTFLGIAYSLAHELGVFDDNFKMETPKDELSEDAKQTLERNQNRRARLRKLLYVYINDLSSRLGWTSLMPRLLSKSSKDSLKYYKRQASLGEPSTTSINSEDMDAGKNVLWNSQTASLIELTRLMKMASETLYPSKRHTRELIKSGRYVSLLEHFQPMLEAWERNYENLKDFTSLLNWMILTEFHFTRVYINSLAIQAVLERTAGSRVHNANLPAPGNHDASYSDEQDAQPVFDHRAAELFDRNSIDSEFIREVVEGSREILRTLTRFSDEGVLFYAPSKIFVRVASAVVFLLKILGLGTKIEEAKITLDVLTKAGEALHKSAVDDMHVTKRFANLLDRHVARVKLRLADTIRREDEKRAKEKGAMSRDVESPAVRAATQTQGADNEASVVDLTEDNVDHGLISGSLEEIFPLVSAEGSQDWFTFPFDPAIAPLGGFAAELGDDFFDYGDAFGA